MSACVRECFARMGAMDPELRGRLSEWLAYHLSNFEFMWPWTKWAQALDAPPHDAQRCAPYSEVQQAVHHGLGLSWCSILY